LPHTICYCNNWVLSSILRIFLGLYNNHVIHTILR
jgi:hypothetical protein